MGLLMLAKVTPCSRSPVCRNAVETVGSVYVVSAGAPEPCAPGVDPPALLCEVAMRCRDAVAAFTALGQPVQAQMGMHVGPIVGKISVSFCQNTSTSTWHLWPISIITSWLCT